MNISAAARQKALLDLYRATRCATGSGLSDVELSDRWVGTGLRESDLRAAIRDLVRRRVLVLRRNGTTVTVVLNGSGKDAMRGSARDVLAQLADWWSLELARLRRPELSPRRRRKRRVPRR